MTTQLVQQPATAVCQSDEPLRFSQKDDALAEVVVTVPPVQLSANLEALEDEPDGSARRARSTSLAMV